MTQTTETEPGAAERQSSDDAPTFLALSIDWDLYGQYLEDSDMTDNEKLEFITVLWSIVVSFVDLGLGIHPAQLATKASEPHNDAHNAPLVPSDNGALPPTTAKDAFAESVVHRTLRALEKDRA